MPDARKSLWWGPPRILADQPGERKISWLELFYDLVYVACISQLKEHLVHHLGPGALGPFLLLFGLVLWSWMNGSYYHDLHGNEGIRTRFLTLLQMLAAAAVAITLAAALAGQTRGFAVAFTLLQLIITYLWWTTGFYDPDHRTLSRNYLITYSLAAVCLAASAFAPALAWQLWGAALLLNLIPGLISAGVSQREHARRGLVLGPSGAIVERFGLLTMIVLGESILGILNGTAAIAEKTPAVWSAFVIGIVIAFELWWIYFDMLGDRRTRSSYLAMQLLNFLHLPLLAAFVVTGAAIQVLLSAAGALAGAATRWCFGGGVALILFMIGALCLIMQEDEISTALTHKIVKLLALAGLAVLLATSLCLGATVPVYLAAIAAILLLTILFGTKLWFAHSLYEDQRQQRE